jgi:hypothetical protein
LPPDTSFPSYRNNPGFANHRIYPSSSALSQVIAILQVALSARQLYFNYGESIRRRGISSPYIVVIPYMLMSLVNLMANAFVGTYTHVTILPMANDTLPEAPWDTTDIHGLEFIRDPAATEHQSRAHLRVTTTPLSPPTSRASPLSGNAGITGVLIYFPAYYSRYRAAESASQ